MDLGLKGRVALVAAGSKGIGRACALGLAREGAGVAVCARGEDALRVVEKDIAELGARAHGIVADVARADGCARAVEETVAAFGRLDVLVTNAGGPPPGASLDFDDEAWLAAIEQNFFSVVRLARAAVPHMRATGWGRIIEIQSYAVKQPIEGLGLSNAARAAAVGFAKTLSAELAPQGITVNTVCPGLTATERARGLAERRARALGITAEDALAQMEAELPMRRLGRPEEVAALVVFLAGEPASYITGTTIQADGGVVRSLL